jgi:LEA14-like dessication related protein
MELRRVNEFSVSILKEPVMRKIRIALMLLMLFGLTACANMAQRAQPLDVSLSDVSLIDIGFIEQRFGVGLRVRNPNAFDMPIEGLNYSLEINGQPFARGMASAPASIPKYGEIVIRTEAISNISHILQQLNTLQKEGKLRYRLQGQADLGGMRGLQPFNMDGEIGLPNFSR